MTLSYWLKTSLELTKSDVATEKNFDVVIIGAGIAGLSTAFWLEKKNPELKIVIVDHGSIGNGASGRNAGFVTCGSAEHFYKLRQQFGEEQALEIWKFSEKNRELLKQEVFGADPTEVDFFSTGSCTVAASTDDWSRYQDLAASMLKAGIDVELINENYLSQNYGVRSFHGAIQYRHDGVVHPVKLLKKIKSLLKNTKFLLDEKVLALTKSGSDWNTSLQNHVIKSNKVIVCLNGYVGTLLPELAGLIKPQRGQIIVTEPLKKFVQGPCYLTKHLCYFRQLPKGELLVGGFRNHDAEAENTDEDAITVKIQAALTDFTQDYFQHSKQLKINHRWSGIMGFSPDRQMVLGEHPFKKGIFVMAGCSGHGMGLSFHAAKVLVESSYQEKIPPHLQISRFSPIFSQT